MTTPEATDPVAQARAQAWGDSISVPPGAERVDSSPSEAFDLSYQGWICSPMALRTIYWTVKGASSVEIANWMLEHPTPGLITSLTGPLSADEAEDGASFGQTPEPNSPYEGVAITIVKTPDGSAIRAEVGARPDFAACQTPAEGSYFGGVGQG